jgi:hypothetical protein
LIPGLDRTDVQLRESASLRVCTISCKRNDVCSDFVRPDEQYCRYHGESGRYLLRHRIAPFLLSVFQIAVYPESTVSTGLIYPGAVNRTAFCQLDISATARIVSAHLVSADGPSRCLDGSLSNVVRDKDRGRLIIS